MEKTLMARAIAFAREIKELTDCEPCELREVIPHLMPCLMGDALIDHTAHLGGNDWRFIDMGYNREGQDYAEAILQEDLENDAYILGCFNASFIASHSDLSERIVTILQEAEAFEELGQYLIDNDCVGGSHGMAADYAQADGLGHHFASYDGETHELSTEGFYAFNLG
jgi:hypothetical protein